MILQTAGSVVVPVVPAQQAAQIQIYAVSFDLQNHTYTLQYGVSGAQPQIDQGPIPAPLLASLQGLAKNRVEAILGIANTTVAAP